MAMVRASANTGMCGTLRIQLPDDQEGCSLPGRSYGEPQSPPDAVIAPGEAVREARRPPTPGISENSQTRRRPFDSRTAVMTVPV